MRNLMFSSDSFARTKQNQDKDDLNDGIGASAGLGLATAQAIVEVRGGSLVLRHSDEAGSTFLATLPARAI